MVLLQPKMSTKSGSFVLALLLTISNPITSFANKAAEHVVISVPLDAKIALDGSIIRAKPVEPVVRPAAAPVINPFVLPPIGHKLPQDDAIRALLSDLFKNRDGARDRYALYLLLMPQYQDIKTSAKATLLNEPSNTIYPLQPYLVDNPKAVINTVIPPSTQGLDPFKGDGAADAIFVQLDGFGSRVPVGVANLLEANFLNGFITRLTLGSYTAFWKKMG